MGPGKLVWKVQDIFKVGAPKPVNRLGIIPDYHDISSGQMTDHFGLEQIGILVFIH